MKAAVRAVALAGLWAADPDVARGAASLVAEHTMDVQDIERYQEVVVPFMFARGDSKTVELAGQLIDFDVFKHTISRARLDAVLQKSPDFASDFRFSYVTNLHRSLRPEHIPVLRRKILHPDPHVRKQSFDTLRLLSTYTDRFRDDVARAVLEWLGVTGEELMKEDPKELAQAALRKVRLPEKRDGYPPLLAAVLRRIYFEPRAKNERRPDAWVQRWAAEERPGTSDAPLLLRLVEAKHFVGRRIALHEAARKSKEMLAAALEVMPKLTIDDWAARALAPGACACW